MQSKIHENPKLALIPFSSLTRGYEGYSGHQLQADQDPRMSWLDRWRQLRNRLTKATLGLPALSH